MKDYYKILQIDRSAGSKAIRKSYRKLALAVHPDVNSSNDAHEKFLEINEAYQVLNHPEKKKKYNRLFDYQNQKQTKEYNIYEKHYRNWRQKMQNDAEKGRNKGQKHSKQSYKKYKRKSFWHWLDNVTDVFIFIGEIFGHIFEIVGAILKAFHIF